MSIVKSFSDYLNGKQTEDTRVFEVAPADQEKFIKDSKDKFKKKYGKRWKEVLYATAWKRHDEEKNESVNEDSQLWGLYTGKKGSGKLGLQFTGTKSECKDEWKDMKDSLDGHVCKIVKVSDDSPENISESEDDSYSDKLHSIISESETLLSLALDKEYRVNHNDDFNIIEEQEIKVVKFKDLGNKVDLNPIEEFKGEKLAQDDVAPKKDEKELRLKTPSAVKSAIEKRLKELKSSMEENGGGGPAETARECLDKIYSHLKKENEYDFKMAQMEYSKLWNEIQERLPTSLVNFLFTGLNKKDND